MERRRKLKEKAEVSEAKPRKIISELNDDELLSYEILANTPSYNADRLFTNRTKKKIFRIFHQILNLGEIAFPEFLKVTHKDEKFLLYDSGAKKFTTSFSINSFQDVVDGFYLIKAKVTNEKVLEFYKYIEDYYIRKRETVKTGRGRGVKITTVLKEPM
ncbi:unnamed protein product [Brachionus calyciflorus]|uniref:Uncharacterized protein n=1 Tax=Brachionus calyciflorus TaxID=104777 RepID=A0A813VU14_9BILA|nr:unnamed protein product [Brachionus calyciflorus]